MYLRIVGADAPFTHPKSKNVTPVDHITAHLRRAENTLGNILNTAA
jgi:hypothetical protein